MGGKKGEERKGKEEWLKSTFFLILSNMAFHTAFSFFPSSSFPSSLGCCIEANNCMCAIVVRVARERTAQSQFHGSGGVLALERIFSVVFCETAGILDETVEQSFAE